VRAAKSAWLGPIRPHVRYLPVRWSTGGYPISLAIWTQAGWRGLPIRTPTGRPTRAASGVPSALRSAAEPQCVHSDRVSSRHQWRDRVARAFEAARHPWWPPARPDTLPATSGGISGANLRSGPPPVADARPPRRPPPPRMAEASGTTVKWPATDGGSSPAAALSARHAWGKADREPTASRRWEREWRSWTQCIERRSAPIASGG
jgi:hypothetical protein